MNESLEMYCLQKRLERKHKKKRQKKKLHMSDMYIKKTKKITETSLNLFFSCSAAAYVGGKAIHYAYVKRGYFAIGSEYMLILIIFVITFMAVKILLEDKKNEETS